MQLIPIMETPPESADKALEKVQNEDAAGRPAFVPLNSVNCVNLFRKHA